MTERPLVQEFLLEFPAFFEGLLVGIGVKVSEKVESQKIASSLFEDYKSSETETHVFTSKTEKFEFHQNVKVGPYSRTVVKAVSYPHKGQIPFKAVYELTPSGTHTIRQMTATLTKYGFKQNFQLTDHGTMIVENEGSLDVDAGYNIDVHIDSQPLNDSKSSQTTCTTLLLFSIMTAVIGINH